MFTALCTITVSALCSSQVTTEEGERQAEHRTTAVQVYREGEGRRPPTSHQDTVITHTTDPVTLWGWEAGRLSGENVLYWSLAGSGGAGVQLDHHHHHQPDNCCPAVRLDSSGHSPLSRPLCSHSDYLTATRYN